MQELFKHTFRSLGRQKGFVALNFIGLFVATTISLLVGLLIFHEYSFDHFHPEGERVFRVVTTMKSSNGAIDHFAEVAAVLPSTVESAMPEGGQFVEVYHRREELVRLSPSKFFTEHDLVFTDREFFDLFQFDVKKGNAREALSKPNMVLLTESTASRYFPKEDAVGKSITLDIADCPVKTFEVAGIMADPPANSHLPFTMLISAASRKNDPNASWSWFMSGQYLYVKTSKNTDAAKIGAKISKIANARKDREDTGHYTYSLQALKAIHTDLDYASSNATYTADVEQFYWLAAVTLFLLLIAIINYVNLATALAQRKAREIGVRKTLGASQSQLALRFVFETFTLVMGAVLCSSIVANLALPTVNVFLGKNIVAHWLSTQMLGFIAVLILATTLLAGFYPALILSGFSPIEAFRRRIRGKSSTSLTLRRSLVVFQFMVAQVFLVAVIVAASQMHYIRSKPLGFNRAGIVNLRLMQAESEKISAFQSEIDRISGVVSTSYCMGAPTAQLGLTTRFNRPERYEQEGLELSLKVAGPTYLETYGLKLLHGRFLQQGDLVQMEESVPEERRKYNCVLNETAVKSIGYATAEAALGNRVKVGLNGIEATIVGVVRDFHTQSLHAPLQSVVIMPFNGFKNTIGIRLDPKAVHTVTLAQIEKVWKSIFPADLFSASFLEDYLATLYLAENRTYTSFRLVALLALLINALGLIGLTVFVVEAKTKEISIRKVLGASVAGITSLLAKDFLKLALIAIVLASPLAYYFMQRWLTDFTYRIDLQWWMFTGAGATAVTIAFLTVGFQSVKAALANPVKSLRSE